MGTDVDSDLKRSAEAFKHVVWPVIGPLVSAGEYMDVELRAKEGDDGMCKALDLMAGIDGWQIKTKAGVMRGIASRVQWIEAHKSPWNSFTIRLRRTTGAKTEYEKRLEVIRHADRGYLYPGLTVQAYLTGDVLRSAAAIETAHLYNFVANGVKGKDFIEKPNGEDGNTFYAVFWSRLLECGLPVKVVEKNNSLFCAILC